MLAMAHSGIHNEFLHLVFDLMFGLSLAVIVLMIATFIRERKRLGPAFKRGHTALALLGIAAVMMALGATNQPLIALLVIVAMVTFIVSIPRFIRIWSQPAPA